MPYLDKRYAWDELLCEIDSGLFKDTECITMDSLDEMMRDLEGEIIETMG
jgi:hypothetical protein